MWVHPFRWKELEEKDEEREKTMNEFEKSDKPVCVCANRMSAVRKKKTLRAKKASNKEQHVCLEIVQATDRVYVQANI